MSIEGLAATAGIHTTYLSGIERGLHNPSWRVIGSLVDALGVDMVELVTIASTQDVPSSRS